MNGNLSALPTSVIVAIVVLGVVELALDVIALVDLYRRPVARVTFTNKWIWVAIILLVNLVGAILYLVVGRAAAVLAEDAQPYAPPTAGTANVADALYGPRGTTGDAGDGLDADDER